MTVHWPYTALMLLAVATGVLISRHTMAGLPLTALERWGIGIGAFCGAMIGAKLPFVLLRWRELAGGGAWLADGKTIMLGLAGGYFGVEIAKWALEIRSKTGDGFAVPVAASVAVGRIACFTAGCCFGTATTMPWGVDFGDGIARHPTQLYEATFHALAAAALYAFWKRGQFRGQLIKLYILSYLAYRFLTEWIRPEPQILAGLTAYQWAALGLAPVFVWLWIRDQRMFARKSNVERIAAEPSR